MILLSIGACTSDDQQDPQPQWELSSVGFEGTLPDGRFFGKAGIESQNSLAGSSSTLEGSYVYHSLSILDPDNNIGIVVDLPQIKYREDYIVPDEAIIEHAAQEHYLYQTVKEKLSIGDKFILSSQTDDVSNTFRLLVLDQKNYTDLLQKLRLIRREAN